LSDFVSNRLVELDAVSALLGDHADRLNSNPDALMLLERVEGFQGVRTPDSYIASPTAIRAIISALEGVLSLIVGIAARIYHIKEHGRETDTSRSI